ncbi:hypothetical protein CLV63_11299 [Murinocardiopsis flavida]|uniref:Tetratricopeptide repeat protein n=1 Tax=Murinocardiopsis flavida TaxID=645275 RepID=A0A2P8DG74_9ACTN|nr:hypothetical protein [Murinocardiopsis flavida]PSK96217.1 hypothetical protein CLV63_11299 [Murinocardiopsis flavida]
MTSPTTLEALPDAARALAARLGLHPAAPVEFDAARALAGQPEQLVRDLLDILTDTGHLHRDPHGNEWRGADPALLAWAATRLAPEERTAAEVRLAAYYVSAAARASRALNPWGARWAPAFESPPVAGVGPDTYDAALDWMRAHLPTLTAIARQAYARGDDTLGWQFADLTKQASATLKLHEPTADLLEAAMRSALRLGAPEPLATVHLLTANACIRTDRVQLGRGHLEEALPLWRQAGDRQGEATTLESLATALLLTADLEQARTATDHSRLIHADLGAERGCALLTRKLADIDRAAGRYDHAIQGYTDALTYFDRINDGYQALRCRAGLGRALLGRGDAGAAERTAERSRTAARLLGATEEEADSRLLHADIAEARHDTPATRRDLERALALYEATGSPRRTEVQARLARLPD